MMNGRIQAFVLFVSYAVASMFGSAHATVLPNGGVISEEISVVGESDTHTFVANAGDSVYLRVADTETTEFINSDFFPRVSLFDPSGTFLTSGQGALVGSVFENLVVSGEYTVVVEDVSSGNDETGTYDLYYAKAPGANEGGALPNGGSVSDRIDLGDIDTYTFTANAGESVYLRVADTETTEFINSDLFPRVELFDPSGTFLTGGQGALVGSLFENLVVSGEYTVVVRDVSSGNDAVGDYDLYYAKAPGADEGGALPNGGSVSDRIDLGDIDTYTFTANAGESVYLRVADTETTEFINSDLFPRVELFDPSGTFLTGGQGALVGSLFENLVMTGEYTVVVRDVSSGDDAVGDYDLYYAKAPGADEGGTLTNGGSVSDRIDLGDIDTYTFTANAGESVFLRVADTETTEFINSDLFPRVELFDPSGTFLTGGQGALVGSLFENLVMTGEYTVVVRDVSSGDDAVGTYDLYYAKAPGANDGNGISGGETKADFIDLGDLDAYAFMPLNVGTNAIVTVTDLDGGDLFPRVALFDPSGAFVTGAQGPLVAEINANLSQSGVYTLVVFRRQ